MDQRLQAWLDPLRETVGKINGHYKHFFERLGCAGAVELHVPEEKVCFSLASPFTMPALIFSTASRNTESRST